MRSCCFSLLALASVSVAQAQPASGRLPLWSPPTQGAALSSPLDYVPAAAQVVMYWRVDDFLKHPEAAHVLAAAGELGEWLQVEAPRQLGVALDDLQWLTIGLIPGEEAPRVTLAGMTKTAKPVTELQAAWGTTTPRSATADARSSGDSAGANVKTFPQGDNTYFLPLEQDGRLIVRAPTALARELSAGASKDRPRRREFDELLARSDESRHFTVLFAPSFWLNSGKPLLRDQYQHVRDWLTWFFPRTTEGALVSMNLDERLFLELRIASSADRKPAVLLRDFRDRVGEASARLESELKDRAATDYDRKVLARLPKMLATLAEFTRADLDGRQVVLRAYLPPVAAHNLALGARLLFEPLPAAPGSP